RQTNLGGGAISLLGGTDWTDYTVQARAKAHVLPTTPETLMALWARSNGTNNHYTFQLLSSGNVALKKRVNAGPVTILGTAPVPVELDRWCDLTPEVFGNTRNAYVDGILVLSRTDTSLPSGHAGLNTYRASASFDDVIVTPRPASN